MNEPEASMQRPATEEEVKAWLDVFVAGLKPITNPYALRLLEGATRPRVAPEPTAPTTQPAPAKGRGKK